MTAFIAMAAVSLLGLPLAARLKPITGAEMGAEPTEPAERLAVTVG